MNVFATDPHPDASAMALDDLRLRKMIVESAQILSTAARALDLVNFDWVDEILYKPTHVNHPCVKWAQREGGNWLTWHLQSLLHQYDLRWPEKAGTTYHNPRAMLTLFHGWWPGQWSFDQEFVNCTPFKEEPVHLAYKTILAQKWVNDKRAPTWTRVGPPQWKSVYEKEFLR